MPDFPLRLEARAEASRFMKLLSPLVAVVLTLASGLVLFSVLGRDPLEAFQLFFVKPVQDLYGLSELLLKATPLMLCAIGLAAGFRANVWNIGAEGQFMFGAVGATGVALSFGESDSALVLPAMAFGGALAGAAWAGIPAFLRTRFNANEILVSLMLVYVAQLTVSWLVFGPWRDPEGFNFPQTAMFGEAALLPVIVEGTRLSVALPMALSVLLACYVFMDRSHAGFRMRVAGEAPAAARYAGFSTRRSVWIGLLVGGATAGLAGMSEVAGPMGQLTDKVNLGYGFAAIIVAFVGRLHAAGILLASLLMALLFLGGEQAQQYMNLPSSISMVFQGLLLFFLLGSDVFIHYRLCFGRTTAHGGR